MNRNIKVSFDISKDEINECHPKWKIDDSEWNHLIHNMGFLPDEYDYWYEEIFAFISREIHRKLTEHRRSKKIKDIY